MLHFILYIDFKFVNSLEKIFLFTIGADTAAIIATMSNTTNISIKEKALFNIKNPLCLLKTSCCVVKLFCNCCVNTIPFFTKYL